MAVQDDLQLYVACVRGGGFAAAAQQLGITRSAVSRRIEGLETRLGVRLITRTTRRFSLTEAGSLFYDRCTTIVADIEAAELAMRERFGAPRGDLHINCAVMIGLKLIIPLLDGFSQAYPGIRVHVDLSDLPVAKNDTTYDAHIRLGRVDDPNLVTSRLARSSRILCATPSYLRVHGRPRAVDDLSKHNCLLISGLGIDYNEWLFQAGGRVETRRVTGRLVFNSGDAHYAALMAGLGIGRMTEIVARADLAAGNLVPVLTDLHHSPAEPIHALFQGGRHTLQKTRAFVEYYRKNLRHVPGG